MNSETNISRLVTGPLSVNTWCIPLDSQRAIIVDPGGDSSSIIAHLTQRELSPVLFFLTHGHFDHLSAIPSLCAAFPGVPVSIHVKDSQWLGKGALEQHSEFFEMLGARWMVDRYGTELPSADIMIEDNQIITLLDGTPIEDWKVLHTPGHSPGGVCYWNEKSSVLISGDTLFASGVGRTDGPGGNQSELERSLARLARLPPHTLVLPGHGEPTQLFREL